MSPILLRSPADARELALHVLTMRIDERVDLIGHIPAGATAVWLHHGQGMIAMGRAVGIATRGRERFEDASAIVRELAASARVDDEVRVRGSGLVAFGSFSYADASPRESTVLVPEAILGSFEGESFLTLISAGRPGAVSPDPAASAAPWRDLFCSTPTGAAARIQLDPDHTPDEYQGLVARAVARIGRGEAGKVVLSESSAVRSDRPVVPSLLARRLAEQFPSTWVYRVGDVVGASPEMLAQTEHGRVFSRVLAGTRPVADGEELAELDRRIFHADAKERTEHEFAVVSVTERLRDVAAGLRTSAEPFVLRLPGIAHLASDVSARLPAGVTSLDVAARLHPSAAVSGTPRAAADGIIGELEPRDRGGYASPVGWMDASGDGQWAIALRMAHLVDELTVRVQAGGGLVAASDPVTEHAEVLAKYRPMLTALRGS